MEEEGYIHVTLLFFNREIPLFIIYLVSSIKINFILFSERILKIKFSCSHGSVDSSYFSRRQIHARDQWSVGKNFSSYHTIPYHKAGSNISKKTRGKNTGVRLSG